MIDSPHTYDLVVLAADGNIEQSIRGLLNRLNALSIREIRVEFITHPNKDSGCRLTAHSLLRGYLSCTRYAVVLLDYEGCGENSFSASELENEIEQSLAANGWNSRCGVVVIDPELEQWVWVASNGIPPILGYNDLTYELLLTNIQSAGFNLDDNRKPSRPKEALEWLLLQAKQPRSSSIYLEMASRISFQRCTDRAFLKLRSLLQEWFPANPSTGS